MTISLVLCSNSFTKKMVLDCFIKWCGLSQPKKKIKVMWCQRCFRSEVLMSCQALCGSWLRTSKRKNTSLMVSSLASVARRAWGSYGIFIIHNSVLLPRGWIVVQMVIFYMFLALLKKRWVDSRTCMAK